MIQLWQPLIDAHTAKENRPVIVDNNCLVVYREIYTIYTSVINPKSPVFPVCLKSNNPVFALSKEATCCICDGISKITAIVHFTGYFLCNDCVANVKSIFQSNCKKYTYNDRFMFIDQWLYERLVLNIGDCLRVIMGDDIDGIDTMDDTNHACWSLIYRIVISRTMLIKELLLPNDILGELCDALVRVYSVSTK